MENFDAGKYRKEIEAELGGKRDKQINYSQEYKQFLSEQLSLSKTLYAKACRLANKILHAPVSEKDYNKINNYLQLLHLYVSPQATLSLAYLSAIIIIIVSLTLSVAFLNFYILIFGLAAAVSALYILSKVPELMFKSWRATASDQLVNAVVYMVIYLEHASNLEQAVYFAAKNLPPPLSLDFIRILWMVESGAYSTISEALEQYIRIWKDWNEGFVEAVHLLESSLYASTSERKHEILDRAINTILDSTEHNMMTYAHESQNPVQAVHMLGIILPVMGLVMLPMVISFLGDVVKLWQIIVLYNILLPIVVFLLAKSTLDARPSGVNTNDIYSFYKYKNYRATINIGSIVLHISPILAGLVIAFLFSAPAAFYFASNYSIVISSPMNLEGITTLTMSLLLILGIGFGLAVYYYLRVKDLVPMQEQLNKLDKEFSNSIFELGTRLEEGMPVESALKRVAETMPQSPIAAFFNRIYENMVKNQQTLKQAIFDEKNGAIMHINSSIIRGVMNIVAEGAKKGSKVVAFSLITISKFLSAVQNVNERMKDLLAETIASLKSEVKLFIPMIAGIVVAMAVLTTSILLNLSVRLKQISSVGGSEEQLGFGATLLDIFKIEYLIPSWVFQLVVGLYLIEVTIIMSYLLSGIIYGRQKVEQDNMLQKNLFISTAIYFVVALVMSAFFITLTKGIGANI